MKKKGISAIVATVLIILVTVAAVTIVWIAIIPLLTMDFVCSDFSTQVSIDVSGGYTYYNPTHDVMIVQIGRNAGNELNLSEMRVTINFEGSSGSEIVPAPQPNQARIYLFNLSNFDDEPVEISVAPIFTKGRRKVECDISSSVNVPISIRSIPEGVYIKFGREGCILDRDCDDGEECTENTCNGDDGCSNEPVADGTECTGGNCEAGFCVTPSGEITDCQTLDAPGGNYFLTGNIIRNDLTDDCFKVTAEDVTLDCQGYSITSINNFAGVYSNNNYTTIKNCIIDMGAEGVGIELEGTNSSYIYNNILRNQYVGINSTGGTFNAVIDDNIIIGNANKGIVFVGDAAYNTISNNNISYNLEDGINLRFTPINNLVTNNILHNNGNLGNGDGIAIDGGNYNTISNNNIANNIDDGIELDDFSEGNIILNNTIDSNSGDGIHIQLGSNKNLIVNNTIESNGDDGIQVEQDSNYNNISFNLIYNNGDIPLDSGDGIVVSNGHFNRLIENTITFSVDDGIQFKDASTDNLAEGNIISNNLGDGLDIQGGSGRNTISNNVLNSNKDEGIQIKLGAFENIITYNTLVNNEDHGIKVTEGSINNWIMHNIINGSGQAPDIDTGDQIMIKAEYTYVINNTIVDGRDMGIKLDGANYSVVENNTIYNNRNDGIAVFRGHNNNVINNTVYNHLIVGSHGIVLEEASFNLIDKNTIWSIFNDGIHLRPSSDSNTIIYNSVRDSDDGIQVEQGDLNNISFNIILQNSRSGIKVEGNYNIINYNFVDSNNLDGAYCAVLDCAGIYISSGSNNDIIGNDPVQYNLVEGIRDEGSSTLIESNIINNNEDDGIQVNGDGGTVNGNTLTSNGNEGIKIKGNNILVSNNLIRNFFDMGILIEGNNTELNGNTLTHVTPGTAGDAIRIEEIAVNTLLINNEACVHNQDLDCRGTLNGTTSGNRFNDVNDDGGDSVCSWLASYSTTC